MFRVHCTAFWETGTCKQKRWGDGDDTRLIPSDLKFQETGFTSHRHLILHHKKVQLKTRRNDILQLITWDKHIDPLFLFGAKTNHKNPNFLDETKHNNPRIMLFLLATKYKKQKSCFFEWDKTQISWICLRQKIKFWKTNNEDYVTKSTSFMVEWDFRRRLWLFTSCTVCQSSNCGTKCHAHCAHGQTPNPSLPWIVRKPKVACIKHLQNNWIEQLGTELLCNIDGFHWQVLEMLNQTGEK